MARNTVRVVIDADAQGFERGFKRAATTSVAMGNIIANLATKAMGAVTDLAGDSIRAASNLNESINAVNVTFGEAAEGILALGKNSADSLGLANAEFNQLAVGFSAFVEKIDGGRGDVAGIMEDLTTRIADFGSVMNIDIPEAAEKFRSGLAGETEPLRKFGIDVSAAAVTAKGLELGLGGASGALSEQEKILARYHLIMDQTAKTAGDFANTSDEFANSQRRLNAALEDARAEIGDALLPVLADLFTKVSDNIGTILNLADSFFVVVGLASEAETAIRKLNREIGEEAAQSAAGLLTAYDAQIRTGLINLINTSGEAEEAVADLADQMSSMADDELVKARDGLEDVAEQQSWTADETRLLGEAIDHELARRLTDTEKMVRAKYNPALEEVAEATEEVASASSEAAAKVKEYRDAQRAAVDPIFAAMRANRDARTAQEEYNLAVAKYGQESEEAALATEGIVDANSDLMGSLTTLRGQGIDPTGAAARNMFRGVGLTDAQINAIFAQFQKIEDNAPHVRMTASVPDLRATVSGTNVYWSSPSRSTFHKGGVVPGPPGADVPIIAQAGETIIPAKQNGHGGTSIIFSGNVYGFDDFESKVTEAIERARRRGAS